MRRVAYIAHTAAASGPNNSLRRLLGALKRDEFEPIVYFPAEGAIEGDLRSAGERCCVVEAIPFGRAVLRRPWLALEVARAGRRLAASLRANRVDVVHANTCVMPHAALAAALAGIPLVCHVRERLRRTWLNDLYLKLGLLRATRVIAVSRSVRDDVLRRTPVEPRRVELIYNGMDLPEFDRRCRETHEGARKPRVPVGAIVISLPAFFLPHKGHDVLLAAIARVVHEARLEVAVWLIGHEAPEDGNAFTRHLQACCRAHRIEGRIHFLGYRADVPALISASHIVCAPSTYPDPLPNSVLEGMAARRAIVASAAGGIPELLDQGRAGLLVPPGDPAALAAALIRLVTDRALRERLGHAARARVEEHFTAAQHADRVERLYRSFLRPHAAVQAAPALISSGRV